MVHTEIYLDVKLFSIGNNRINKKKQKGNVRSKSTESFITVVIITCRGLDLFK